LLRSAFEATGIRQHPGWRCAKRSLLVVRMPVTKVRSAVKRRKSIRSCRILGMPLQWNHSDQKCRANALEQSTFEASPGG
jgi:hypothetical protein